MDTDVGGATSLHLTSNMSSASHFLAERVGHRKRGRRSSLIAFVPQFVTLPVAFLATSSSLLLLALGNCLGRVGSHWAELCFWVALITMFIPNAAVIVHPLVNAGRRIGHLLLLALGDYMVKFYQSPLYFTNHDEYCHWRTLIDIMRSGHLFTPNPLLPVSSLHPGMEVASSALVSLSGFSPFTIGIVVAMIARIIFIGGLYLFLRQLTRSSQISGIGVLVYMGQANFLFFNAMYKYESLAIAFMIVCLFFVLRASNGRVNRVWDAGLAVLVGLGAVVTHHLTSYALLAFLALWSIAGFVGRWWGYRSWNPWPVAVVLAVSTVAWVAFIASSTIAYLGSSVSSGAAGMVRLLATELRIERGGQSRALFADYSGHVSPLWERFTALGSAGMLVAGLIAGLAVLYTRRERSVPRVVWALVGAVYPLTLAFRLSPAAWEIGNRSSEFVFVGVGFVVAVGLVQLLQRYGRHAWVSPAMVLGLCIVFLGGAIAGWPPPWRLPGPYLPSSDTRSVEKHGIYLAQWARTYMPENTVVGADRTNSDFLATGARMWPSSTLNGGVDVPFIIYSPHFGPEEQGLLRRGHISYLVVDRRLVRPPFASRTYIEFPNLTDAILTAAKRKFDRLRTVDRVYDNGDIRVYDVRNLGGSK